jgi:thioredoxin 1
MKQIVKHEFDVFVMKGKETCLVDFYADWCNPCKKLHSTLEEVSSRYVRLPFYKVNVDDDPEIAQSFGIRSIPTVILFKDGKAVKTLVGNLPAKSYVDAIEDLK